MERLDLTPTARDFIFSCDWSGAMIERAMDESLYVPTLVWLESENSDDTPASIGLAPMLRCELPNDRYAYCGDVQIDVAHLLPEEMWRGRIHLLVDASSNRLVLLSQ